MSGKLRETCLSLSNGYRGRTQPGEPLELTKLANKWAALPAAENSYLPRNPAEVAAAITYSLRGGKPLSRSQLRQAPWCLWTSEGQLSKEPDLLSGVLQAVASADRDRPYRSLASAYVDAFSPELPGLALASQYLIKLSERWPGPWSRLQYDFAIFDPEAGPERLAAAAIVQDRAASEIVADYGVQAMGTRSGYVRAVTTALLAELADGDEADHVGRLTKVQRYALKGHDPLFEESSAGIALALLKPFGQVSPQKDVRDTFLDVILAVFGDPRLPRVRKRSLPPPYDEVVSAWLTEQSLRQFLDVVDQTTERPDMWKYRRAFWFAAYEAGMIEAAWVAFGAQGMSIAKESFGDEVRFAGLFQQRKPVDAGHAVLLMRIGNGVIADWSHMGMCNIWLDSGDPTAPRLYEDSYGSNDVQISEETSTTEAFSHVNPTGYTWQRRAADFLFRMTGRRLSASAYRIA